MILGTPGEMTAEKLKAPSAGNKRCMLCRTLYSAILLWIIVYHSNTCANWLNKSEDSLTINILPISTGIRNYILVFPC